VICGKIGSKKGDPPARTPVKNKGHRRSARALGGEEGGGGSGPRVRLLKEEKGKREARRGLHPVRRKKRAAAFWARLAGGKKRGERDEGASGIFLPRKKKRGFLINLLRRGGGKKGKGRPSSNSLVKTAKSTLTRVPGGKKRKV